MGTGTSIGRVRGLGAAKEGTHHWWRQRLTAGLNIALMAWLLLALARQPGFDFASVKMWLSSAWVAVPMAVLIANVFYHFRLGLQVVIEDYQHDHTRVVLMVLLNLYVVVLGAIAIFSVLRLAFTGAPR
ncbi:succinate dehydrogenase, hydrophobic membrane anchor protein [Sphingomonas sp.]|jgi:succinate dehydrogenase / fumarate reductase membrane anchor subunit|uniref:succinate dehydrogenase, hydrophobic membrane anchor protein n=1 Tax=Sphingomonas sp. TaxID=28214 RepID=UPI002D8077E5|nr:succinate dehydrogenase, hydrophobic membrane anchor protein [Sphingomonas sp.]HEU0045845.1 succinate dehydrogenase, hydrophobic membrane anchor protein [Sphingomonas sp.]